MPVPVIVPIYAGLLGLGLILLSVRVIRLRRAARVPIGAGTDSGLERAMRVQANFTEYVPLTLLLLAFAETGGTPGWLLHILCLALLIGRAVHAAGVSRAAEDFRFRVFGMACTLTVLGAASLLAAGLALTA